MNLKKAGQWELNKVVQTKYFKNGKPSLHAEVTYEVVKVDSDGIPVLGAPSVFWLKSKRTAEKHFAIVTNPALDALQRSNAIDSLYGKVIGE